jgi:hypothetical protein
VLQSPPACGGVVGGVPWLPTIKQVSSGHVVLSRCVAMVVTGHPACKPAGQLPRCEGFDFVTAEQHCKTTESKHLVADSASRKGAIAVAATAASW